MENIFSWLLIGMTGGFFVYWVTSYLFLKLGSVLKVGIGVIEFFRIWLKPLFFINFLWFLIIEIIFSLIYWTLFLLKSVIAFLIPVFKMMNNFHPEEGSFFMWIFISILIYIVVMTPYFFLQFKLSFHFKQTIFNKLAPTFNAQKTKFHGQSSGLKINQNLFTQLAAKDELVSQWVKKSLEDFSSKPGNEDRRFSISMRTTDYMSWEINNIKSDFFEAVINFKGEVKVTDDKGKTSYDTELEKELFDGIVILIEDALESPWSTTLFEIEQNFNEKKIKNRAIHKQNFLISIYNDIVFNSMAKNTTAAYNNSQLTQYFEPEKLKIKTNSVIPYIMCENRNIYLFLQTELESTSFDLNMNIRVRESMELFKQDLTIVQTAISEIEPIMTAINASKSESNQITA
jgi:hypothetical protein